MLDCFGLKEEDKESLRWTHSFKNPHTYGEENCVILSHRKESLGKFAGDVMILTDSGYVGWEASQNVKEK